MRAGHSALFWMLAFSGPLLETVSLVPLRYPLEHFNIEALYKMVHAAIRADPTMARSTKEPPKTHKRYNLKKLTHEERKAKLVKRLNALNSAGADEDEDDE